MPGGLTWGWVRLIIIMACCVLRIGCFMPVTLAFAFHACSFAYYTHKHMRYAAHVYIPRTQLTRTCNTHAGFGSEATCWFWIHSDFPLQSIRSNMNQTQKHLFEKPLEHSMPLWFLIRWYPQKVTTAKIPLKKSKVPKRNVKINNRRAWSGFSLVCGLSKYKCLSQWFLGKIDVNWFLLEIQGLELWTCSCCLIECIAVASRVFPAMKRGPTMSLLEMQEYLIQFYPDLRDPKCALVEFVIGGGSPYRCYLPQNGCGLVQVVGG